MDVFIGTFVRSAGQGQFFIGEPEELNSTTFDKRQNLKWLGTGTHKGDRLRVAIGCEQLAMRVHHSDPTVVNRLYDLPAG